MSRITGDILVADSIRPPRVVINRNPQRMDSLASEDLPVYSENPEYETVPHPEAVARKAVKSHEKKVKQDLKDAEKAEIQCARIRKILPQIYAQLTAAVDAPRTVRTRTGPAALRAQTEETGIEISFKSRGIDQKALRRYLPALLVEYQAAVEASQRATQANESEASDSSTTTTAARPRRPPMSRSNTEPVREREGSVTEGGSSQYPPLTHAATTIAVRRYDPDRMSVSAEYFEDYTQKIYFSKQFLKLWKKKDGKRENLAGGIAMILIGLKLGLPIFDLFTFVALDVPRLALQGITGKHTLKMKD